MLKIDLEKTNWVETESERPEPVFSLLISCVTLHKSPDLSQPQLSYLRGEKHNYFAGLFGEFHKITQHMVDI